MANNKAYKRLGQVLLAMLGVGGALLVAVSVGAITLPGTHSGTQSAQARRSLSSSVRRFAFEISERRRPPSAC